MEKMKITVLAVILVTLLATIPAQAYDWVTNPANGHRYTMFASNWPVGWTQAEEVAVVLGGHLATINDSVENEWVRSTFMPLYYFHWAWIGFYEVDYNQRTWAWVSGESSTYTNWGPGEPNGPGAEHWTAMMGDGKWADLSDSWPWDHFAVVEVVPEPSSLFALSGGLAGLIAFRKRRKL